MSQEELNRRVCAAWGVLISAAHNSQILTYTEFGRLLGFRTGRGMRRYLEPIYRFCQEEEGVPDLTCLVVEKETGMPSREGDSPHARLSSERWAEEVRKIMDGEWRIPNPPDFTALP